MSGRSVKATPGEIHQVLAGDDLISEPLGSLTHAITIRRRPHDIWPWIAQMGAGSRAGWYSYDFLDNGRRPSAEEIRADLQRFSVGTVFPALPGIREGFVVLAFEAERYLVLGWPAPDGSVLVTWAFVLQQIGGRSTRLIVRARAGAGYRFHGLPLWVSDALARAVHFVMQRKQLLEIARRAESSVAVLDEASHSKVAGAICHSVPPDVG
jgi:hypothetical protein